ncbi:hypothetical protein Y032_0071g619 [Ancylostoma ceylanicum]|uniref:Uncharacterized protein n=1 Tax=Ancylostoma ceylanicum TaxID=53326 RepID=A0A016TXK9_9BILA|nr:hypothetical protein Y032_0071g619 [Ancylostoma ceylanicum]
MRCVSARKLCSATSMNNVYSRSKKILASRSAARRLSHAAVCRIMHRWRGASQQMGGTAWGKDFLERL